MFESYGKANDLIMGEWLCYQYFLKKKKLRKLDFVVDLSIHTA